ncbi:MAG: hypothetical protein JNG83_01640 [Opitutaceae bacterium]|nr:hypothetical protein [Opitutaceae bacterium]
MYALLRVVAISAPVLAAALSGTAAVPQFQPGLGPAAVAPSSGPRVLEDPRLPIVAWFGPGDRGGAVTAWIGPGGAALTDTTMRDLAAAGFNISLSFLQPENLTAALDVAHRHGVRLIVMLDEFRVTEAFVFDEAKKQSLRRTIHAVRHHPGLYGYFLSDEPAVSRFGLLAEVAAFIRAEDPDHLALINLETPVRQDGFGAGSAELKWGRFIDAVKPAVLSSHQYPIRIGWEEEFGRLGNGANRFGSVIVKPEMFEVLEHYRSFSLARGIPFWAFACSVHHGPYPPPTEGFLRFQLLCNLAYGARGLQYFTYAYASALVRPDGTPQPELAVAARVNRELHQLWRVLGELQSIAVYHAGPPWSGTRALPPGNQPMTVNLKGDPAVVGVFQDREGMKYVLLVNRNPVDWGRFEIEAHVQEGPDQHLTFLDPEDGVFFRRWPYRAGFLPVTLPPGGGILFRLGGDGPRRF